MESQIKSSFIPQDVGKEMRVRPRMGDSSDLLVLGAVILLMASLALAGGVFLYSKYLGNSIEAKQSSIDRARAAIEPALIQELTRLDNRMQSSSTLLSQHISISAVFSLLEQITLKSMALTELSITTEAPDYIKIAMKGVAKSVNSIALQSDLYGKSGVITSPIFSDINRGGDGLTRFRVDALLNPNAIRYGSLVTSGAQVGQQIPTVEENQSEGTTDTQGASSGSEEQTSGTEQ